MSFPSLEGVNEVRRPLYRVSIKLLCLQERLHSQLTELPLNFAYSLHHGLQQSSRLISMCFSEGRDSGTYLGCFLLSWQDERETGSQAEPKRSDPHSEQNVSSGVTGSRGGPEGRGRDLQFDLQAV